MSLLHELIKIKSTEEYPDQKYAIIQYVQELFVDAGLYTKLIPQGNNYNLVISNQDEYKTFYFLGCAHLDVVPGHDDLFSLQEDDVWYYGRGVLDMKGAASVMIDAFLDMSQKILASKKTIGLLFTTDEETGSHDGMEFMTREYGINGEIVYIPDTGEGMNKLLEKGKGYVFAKIHSYGSPAHGSMPRQGKSAIMILVDIIKKIYEKYPQPTNNQEGTMMASSNFGMIQGGSMINGVPENARLTLDHRFPPQKGSAQHQKDGIMKVLAPYESSLSVEWLADFDGFDLQVTGEQYGLYCDIVNKYLGENKIERFYEYGSNDGKYFLNCSKTLIMTGPYGEGFHANNEKVLKSELVIFRNTITEYLNFIL